MLQLSSETYISFFSSNAQIFGALIGLLGLTFVRIAETFEQNIGRMISSLVRDFMHALLKVHPEKNDIAIDIQEFGAIMDQYKDSLGESHHVLQARYSEVIKEIDEKRGFKKKFVTNCWLSFALISFSLLGLLLPTEEIPLFTQIFTIILFIASLIGIFLTIRFYLAVANTTMVLTFDSEP